MLLELHKLRFRGAVAEGHVLQLALAAGIAHRAIKRVIAKQHLDHGLARLPHLIAFRNDHHAVGDGNCACGLQLRHLFNPH